ELGLIKQAIDADTWNIITTTNTVFLCVSTVIVTLVLFYVLLKVIKYSVLKDGKGKMCAMEYFNFIKKLLKEK
ncbi:variable surface protein Vir35, truncated, putative, partial [Plasmodium vivax]